MKKEFFNFVQKLCINILDYLNERTTYDETLLSQGDVVWCLMPLSQKKLMKVSPGHRIRPFVIVENNSAVCRGYACSSKCNSITSSASQYFIDKDKYHVSKSSYVDVSHKWEIPYENVQSFYFKLDEKDFYDLTHFNKQKKKKTQEFGKGTIIQKNHKYYLIYGFEDKLFLAYPLLSTKPQETKDVLVFAYKEEIYYLDLKQHLKIDTIQSFQYCSQIAKEQVKQILNQREETKLKGTVKPKKVDLNEIRFMYPCGTIFYEDYQEECFIYLFHRKKKAYGIYTEENQGVRYILRRVNLAFMRTNNEICDHEYLLDVLYDLPVNEEMECVIKYLRKRAEIQEKATCVG